MIERPARGEVTAHYQAYVDLVEPGAVADRLASQAEEVRALFAGLSSEQLHHRYAPGKWSRAEVLSHLFDGERIFAGRLLAFARGDQTSLPGFDENEYVRRGNFDARSLGELLREYTSVREATLSMLPSLDGERQLWSGTANGVRFTVRAMPYIIAGHERHHLGVLRERYR